MDTTITQLHTFLHTAAIQISKYSYNSEVEDLINDTYKNIETELSHIESSILPSLPPSKIKDDLEYTLFKSNERFKDLKALYRAKKINEKKKYLESLYYKSFDISELLIRNEGKDSAAVEGDFKIENADAHEPIEDEDEQLEELSAQEKLLKQNTLLTDKLQNVNALMKSTLLAGEINLNELEISTKSLSNLSDSYEFFGNILNKTNTLVKSINKASKSERAMIYRSLYFFTSVCCWILWRRIFKRPLLLVLWLIYTPIKTLFWNQSNESNVPPLSDQNVITDTILSVTTAIIEEIVTKDEL
jgi:hypothetical protein